MMQKLSSVAIWPQKPSSGEMATSADHGAIGHQYLLAAEHLLVEVERGVRRAAPGSRMRHPQTPSAPCASARARLASAFVSDTDTGRDCDIERRRVRVRSLFRPRGLGGPAASHRRSTVGDGSGGVACLSCGISQAVRRERRPGTDQTRRLSSAVRRSVMRVWRTSDAAPRSRYVRYSVSYVGLALGSDL